MKTEKRNYRLGVLNGIFMRLSSSEIDGNTLLPLFVSNLTSSNILIGCSSALSTLGQNLPQLLVANLVEDQPRKKPLYVTMAWVRAVSLAILAALIFAIGVRQRQLMLAFFFVLFLLHTLAGGIANIPFYDIVGKITASRRRSHFFSARYFWGGIFAAFMGLFIVKPVLAHCSFPQNYGILFSVSSLFFVLAMVSFALIKEPIHPVRTERRRFRHYFRDGLRFLKTDRNYRTLILIDLSEGLSAIAIPFYVIFARKVLGMPEAMAGTFIFLQMTGLIISNLAWQRLGERGGSRIILQVYAFLTLVAPAIALVAAKFKLASSLLFGVLFFLRGAKVSAQGVGQQSYLLDIAPAIERPTYLAFMNTLALSVVFLPGLGGVIVNLTSFEFLFGLSLVFALVTFLLSLRLEKGSSAQKI